MTDLVDPDSLGRIEVRFPFLGTDGDRDVRAWATLCTPYADDDQGLAILPEVGSQVVVAFEAGNLRRPYIVGCAWNGTAALPHDPEQANNIRVLRTRADSRLEFDDTAGAAKVTITTDRVTRWCSTRAPGDHHPARQRLRHPADRDRRRDPGECHRGGDRADGRGHRADLDVQRHRAVPDADRRGRRRLAGLHPRRREPLVTGFVLRAPWYVRERGKVELRDPRALRPAIQMYDGTDFVQRLLGTRATRWPSRQDDHWSYPVPVSPTFQAAQAGRLRLATHQLVHTKLRKLYQPSHNRFYVVVVEVFCDQPGLPRAGSHDDIDVAFVMRRHRTSVTGERRSDPAAGPSAHAPTSPTRRSVTR